MGKKKHKSSRREVYKNKSNNSYHNQDKFLKSILQEGQVYEVFGSTYKVTRLLSATKDYVCPGCEQKIPVGKDHLVVWKIAHLSKYQIDQGIEFRRHWHTTCWEINYNQIRKK